MLWRYPCKRISRLLMLRSEKSQLALIIIIFIAACMETDIYLPAFADMMKYFNVSEEGIQSLLTWNFIGICLSCPFYGPLSDAFGRKKPLFTALALFALGSLVTVFADDFFIMIIGRVLQGLGSGGCFTLGTAIIFDVFPKEKAQLAINRLNTIIPMIMALAPMAGGILNQNFGFRSNFLCIFVFVAISMITCFFAYKETLPLNERMPLKPKKIAQDFKRAFLCLPFWQTTIFASLFFSIYIGFLSIVSVLFVLELGVDKSVCPLFQSAVLGAWLLASINFSRASKLLGKYFRAFGLTFSFLGVLLFCLFALMFPKNPYLMTSGIMIQAIGFNFIMTIYFDESMRWLDDIKGIAASLLTSTRLLLTAIFVGISGRIYDQTIIPFALLSLGAITLCGILIWHYESRYAKEIKSGDGEIIMAGH